MNERAKAPSWWMEFLLERESRIMGKLLIFVSGFTMICMFWLASMEMELRHPGYGTRMAIDMCFALSCLTAAIFRMLPSPRTRSELCLRGAGLLMILFGALTFHENAHAAHFEGFVFVISIVLVVQGLLMLMTLGRRGSEGEMHSAR